MQHRQSGFPDPDEAPARGRSGEVPSGMPGGEPGGPFGDTRFVADDDPGPAPRGSSGAWLRAQRGSVDVIEVALDRQVLVIGRRLTNDVVIHDTNVSRQHARLLRGPDGYSIEDTQSSNGTFVNDERVFGPRPLRDGDVIRIGDAAFVYEAAAPPAPPAESAAGLADAGMESGPADWTRALPDVADVDLLPPEGLPDERPATIASAPEGVPIEYAPPPGSGLSADELEDELARRDASPAAANAADIAPGGQVASPAASSATGTALADVSRDLAALAETATRLADRVRMLEGALEAKPRRTSDPRRPSSDDTVALVEFSRLLRDLQTFGDPEAAKAAANLLDELSRQPRDVELLLSISRQAPIMAVVLRQHAYLMRLAPLLDEALGRMLD